MQTKTLAFCCDLTSVAWTAEVPTLKPVPRCSIDKWLLLPRFQIAKPYELVAQDAVAVLPQGQRTGPYIEMSVVGFNHDETRAVGFVGSGCGGLSGSSHYHLLEKEQGKWKEAQGVICARTS
jgi:hypothetical protein